MERGAEQGSSGRLVFRFVVGTAELTGERLAAALRVLDERRVGSDALFAGTPLAPRHILLGALCAAPAGLQSAVARARPLAERTGQVATRGLRALARLPGGPRMEAAYRQARARAWTQI